MMFAFVQFVVYTFLGVYLKGLQYDCMHAISEILLSKLLSILTMNSFFKQDTGRRIAWTELAKIEFLSM